MANFLIVVDVQNDFCPGGALGVENGDLVAVGVRNHLNRVESIGEAYDYVVATKDWHIDPGEHFSETPDYVDSWPVHCVADTKGAAFHPALTDAAVYIDEVFYKGQYTAAYSGFEGHTAEGVSLGDWMIERVKGDFKDSSVTVVGIATDYCVKATALDSAGIGFDTQVIWSLCAAVNPRSLTPLRNEFVAAGVTLHEVD